MVILPLLGSGARGLLTGLVVGIIVGVLLTLAFVPFTVREERTQTTSLGRGQPILEAYDWTDVNHLNITLKNLSSSSITIYRIYLNGILQNGYTGDCPIDNGELASSATCFLSIAVSCPLSSTLTITLGRVYSLRIEFYEDLVVSYPVTAGQSTALMTA